MECCKISAEGLGVDSIPTGNRKDDQEGTTTNRK